MTEDARCLAACRSLERHGTGAEGLRIGIDARNLVLPHGTGIATYGTVLAQTLPLIRMQPAVLRAGVAQGRPARWASAALGRASVARAGPGGWVADDLFRTAQVQFDMRRGLRPVVFEGPPDVMHWTSPLPLRAVGCPGIVSLHDLIPLLQPELAGTKPGRQRRLLSLILHAAHHVVAVSETTRNEAIRHLGLPPGKITNAWQAVDVSGSAATAPAGLTPGGYWLHVGTVERRKNLVSLIQAWRASGVAGPLVLAGPDGWQAAEVMAERAGDPRILRLPWLDRAELLALIRDARALVFPSLAEGFGLPLAEALALGTPALVSDRGALAEVAANAALTVDPASVRAIAGGIAALDRDTALRQRLSAAGHVRAALFTPAAYAARLEPIYRAVLAHTAITQAAARR